MNGMDDGVELIMQCNAVPIARAVSKDVYRKHSQIIRNYWHVIGNILWWNAFSKCLKSHLERG